MPPVACALLLLLPSDCPPRTAKRTKRGIELGGGESGCVAGGVAAVLGWGSGGGGWGEALLLVAVARAEGAQGSALRGAGCSKGGGEFTGTSAVRLWAGLEDARDAAGEQVVRGRNGAGAVATEAPVRAACGSCMGINLCTGACCSCAPSCAPSSSVLGPRYAARERRGENRAPAATENAEGACAREARGERLGAGCSIRPCCNLSSRRPTSGGLSSHASASPPSTAGSNIHGKRGLFASGVSSLSDCASSSSSSSSATSSSSSFSSAGMGRAAGRGAG